jgi:hypothetical protein
VSQHWQSMRALGYAAAIGTTFAVAYLWLRLISTTTFTMQPRSNCQEHLPRVHALAELGYAIKKRSKLSLGKGYLSPLHGCARILPDGDGVGAVILVPHGSTNKDSRH